MTSPLVSVIIVSWNGRELLLKCLQSIAKHCPYPHQVIVVDNGSTDGTPAMVRDDFATVTLIANPTNRGFAAANNQGLRIAHGQFMVFLNPDTELIEEPFLPLIDQIKQNPEIGCIGPELLNTDRTHQPSARPFPSFWDQLLILLKLRPFFFWTPVLKKYLQDPAAVEKGKVVAVDQLMGAVLLMPRRVLTVVGEWDEQFWIWFEEVDLCYRIQRHGWRVVYAPLTRVVHYGGAGFGHVLSWRKQWWFLRSLWRYTRKHWAWWPRTVLAMAMPVSYLLVLIQSTFKPR